ncbi:MAG: FecR family protein, partial [Butyricimonas paravirosa]
MELADGTRVWLNAQSELRYPVQFIGNQRVVYLKGEGYFEVTSNEEKPFIVRTLSDVEVKVLGTRFNVSAYEDDADVTTTLAEGSVEVTVGGESIRIV